MKKLFAFPVFIILFTSCEKKSANNDTIKESLSEQSKIESPDKDVEDHVRKLADSIDYAAQVSMDGENPKVTKAKKLIDESTDLVLQSINGNSAASATNKKVESIMADYEILFSNLSTLEQKHVQEYRETKAKQVIDAQVKASK